MKLVTPKALADESGVSRSAIYELIRQGRLPAYRVGVHGKGKILIRPEDWEAFLTGCRVAEWTPVDGELTYLG